MIILSVGKILLFLQTTKNSLLTFKMSLLMLNATQNTSETCGRRRLRRVSCEVNEREKKATRSHIW